MPLDYIAPGFVTGLIGGVAVQVLDRTSTRASRPLLTAESKAQWHPAALEAPTFATKSVERRPSDAGSPRWAAAQAPSFNNPANVERQVG